mgnify:FL=1
MRKVLCKLMICAVIIGCMGMYAGAVYACEDVVLERFELAENISRATGAFETEVAGNTTVAAGSSFLMDVGETVTIDATYSPRSASVDFGLIAPDGLFYPVRGQNGSINKTIEIVERGNYTFAIRNNSSVEISVSGFVKY